MTWTVILLIVANTTAACLMCAGAFYVLERLLDRRRAKKETVEQPLPVTKSS